MESQRLAFMGHVNSVGAVHATEMTEDELTKKMHYSSSYGWRYKPSSNTLVFWNKPPEKISEAVLNWLAKKNISPQISILMVLAKKYKEEYAPKRPIDGD